MNNKMIIAGGAAVLLAGVGFIVFSSDDEIAEVIHEAEIEMAQEVRTDETEEGEGLEVDGVNQAESVAVSSQATPDAPAPIQINSVMLGEINNGNSVTVPYVHLLKDGYVVLYRINSQGDTSLMGKSDLLEAGTHTDVKIRLGTLIVERQALVAVLHGDDGDGKFEYPGADEYLLNGGILASDIDVVGITRSDRESRVLETQVEAFLETNFKD